MHIVFAVSLGTIATLSFLIFFLFSLWRSAVRRRRLERRRHRQEIARLAAMEKALQPATRTRLGNLFRR